MPVLGHFLCHDFGSFGTKRKEIEYVSIEPTSPGGWRFDLGKIKHI